MRSSTYVATLVVTDAGGLPSTASSVTISSTNVAPTADAGSDTLVSVNTTVGLDGLGSSDPESDPLTYSWTLSSKPVGSTATLVAATNATPTLSPDLVGDYVVELVVNDGFVDSAADSVTINAISASDYAQGKLQQVCDALAGMSPSQFDAKGHHKSMQNACAQIAKFLQKGQTGQAKDKLQDLITRLDGVANGRGVDPKGNGQAHAADFITDAAAQGPLYTLLTDALSVLP